MSIYRLYVEKKTGHNVHAKKVLSDIKHVLNINVFDVRIFIRYDVDGMNEREFIEATSTIFSEPPVDTVYREDLPEICGDVFGVEYLPGQYDQRADSAAQCVQLLTLSTRPLIRCATIYAVEGADSLQLERIKKYLINPVEARLCSLEKASTLEQVRNEPDPVEMLDNFIDWNKGAIEQYHNSMGFAMSREDLLFVQSHFKSERRNPTLTELKVIDTYWSDHCRHTTFLTSIENVKIKSDVPQIAEAYETYLKLFNSHYNGRIDKYPNLMDIATMGARELKRQGKLQNLDESEEINACSIKVNAVVDGAVEQWLVMFKNETHNHPTEIEPFGGAATCLGGAIRDPLSGRVYVYQAMRITGAGDVNLLIEKTIKGKLPQRVISKTAAAGFSSYGNQIGLATGLVREVYHSGYAAKRLETGFVVGAAPEANVIRKVPQAGDVVVLIGGETGRDGCGGATGSSKAHTVESIDKCGAEVQKGNPLTERKIQRLFRNEKVTQLIKRCNDFGAGGISVAIGELSDGLDIDLDVVPKKYYGLNATELAISESQERMAVVVAKADAAKIIKLCAEENLNATIVASVTDNERMRMFYSGKMIVDLSRKFLNSNGVRQTAKVIIKENSTEFFDNVNKDISSFIAKGDYENALLKLLASYNVCSQKGLGEMFDSTIGAGSVLMPFGGKTLNTPSMAMAAKLPVTNGTTDTATVAAYGYNPYLMSESPFVGAIYSVLLSVEKVVATGAPIDSIRLTLQEFFERLYDDPYRWGKPTSALLGALYAQLKLGLAAIGGKDSMSGTFEKIDVPPTLISFALGVGDANNFISNTLTRVNQKVYRARLKRDKNNIPNFEYTLEFLKLLQGEISRGIVDFAAVVEDGGTIGETIKSCFGNEFGFVFTGVDKTYFTPSLGDILLSTEYPEDFVGYDLQLVGMTIEGGEFILDGVIDRIEGDTVKVTGGKKLAFKDALAAFSGTFESVYPTTAESSGEVKTLNYTAPKIIKAAKKVTKPTVFIPVFPGTNCEYDTAKRFILAGAKAEIYVIKNQSPSDIDEAVKDIAKLIAKSQIIAFPGGFSGGDEPDGSGKFIATAFRNSKISEAIMDLLYKRDGLCIGICNGFQALIKLGLLPEGKIAPMTEKSPTLTFNNISRHVSTVSRIRVASNLSPWFNNVKVGETYAVAISHGEGKFVAEGEDLIKLEKFGQIATQYADLNNEVTMRSPYNPNGSYMAIEGITSVDGRVLGKMGHSERIGTNIMKNIDMPTDMKIFEAGVKYFK